MSVSSDSTSFAHSSSATQQSTQTTPTGANNGLSYLSNHAAEVANNWLLPDGVGDVLFSAAQKQEVLQDCFEDVWNWMTTYGTCSPAPAQEN